MNTWVTDVMKKINSEICEQIFSTLLRISKQVAYMRIENVFYTLSSELEQTYLFDVSIEWNYSLLTILAFLSA